MTRHDQNEIAALADKIGCVASFPQTGGELCSDIDRFALPAFMRTWGGEYPQAMLETRRDEILAAYRNLTPEQQANVIDELAELSTVTDWEDERNSRPFPY